MNIMKSCIFNKIVDVSFLFLNFQHLMTEPLYSWTRRLGFIMSPVLWNIGMNFRTVRAMMGSDQI